MGGSYREIGALNCSCILHQPLQYGWVVVFWGLAYKKGSCVIHHFKAPIILLENFYIFLVLVYRAEKFKMTIFILIFYFSKQTSLWLKILL